MKKSKYRLYDKNLHCWVQYTEEAFLALRRERNRIRKRALREERCVCPWEKEWYCDGICDGCPFQKNDEVSLNAPAKKDATLTLEECLTDEIDQEAYCVESLDFQKILSRLDELMPEAREIGRLRLQGIPDQEISKQVGLSRVTIYRRLQKVYAILSTEFEEIKKIKKISQKVKQKDEKMSVYVVKRQKRKKEWKDER